MAENLKSFGTEFLLDIPATEYGCGCGDLQGLTVIVDGVTVGTVDASAPGGFRRG